MYNVKFTKQTKKLSATAQTAIINVLNKRCSSPEHVAFCTTHMCASVFAPIFNDGYTIVGAKLVCYYIKNNTIIVTKTYESDCSLDKIKALRLCTVN